MPLHVDDMILYTENPSLHTKTAQTEANSAK